MLFGLQVQIVKKIFFIIVEVNLAIQSLGKTKKLMKIVIIFFIIQEIR